MFGHQDDHDHNDNDTASQQNNSIPDASIHAALEATESIAPAAGAPAVQTDQAATNSGLATISPTFTPASRPDVSSSAGGAIVPTDNPSASDTSDASTTHELIDIKQQALSQLSPLMSHLDQTPEEKFRTTMMMIQASDNQSLIKAAYAAAQSIADEKVRAQALLDVINEINYFTQQPAGQ